MVIEILNPANPATYALTLLVNNYLRLCANDQQIGELKREFNDLLFLIEKLVEKKAGTGGINLYVNMSAAYLAAKFRVPVTEVTAGLRVAKAMIQKEISK